MSDDKVYYLRHGNAIEGRELPQPTPPPSGVIEINENGRIDVTQYAEAEVNVVDPLLGYCISGDFPSNYEMIIPDGVTKIRSNCFYNIGNIKKVTIPDSVTLIAGGAFNYCGRIQEVDIGSGVQEMGSQAFAHNGNLETVYCRAITPPSVTMPFASSNVDVIYVPEESVDVYKAASGWSDYASIIQAIPV